MAQVSFSVETAGSLSVVGSGLPPNATVTLTIAATGSPGMSVSGPTDATGAISADIPITDAAILALLPMIGQGQWNDDSSAWAVSVSDGTNEVAMNCSVA